MITFKTLSPTECKKLGSQFVIHWGIHETAIGPVLLGLSGDSICWLSPFMPGAQDEALQDFETKWAQATRIHAPEKTASIAARLPNIGKMTFLLCGTPFQIQVWETLAQIPLRKTFSYQEVANKVGRPKAVRAVGQAVGANPIGWLIPCHRVIGSSGKLHGFRWGLQHKQAMLDWEAKQAV